MEVALRIRTKGTNTVLSIWPGSGVGENQFLKCAAHLLSLISNVEEFFFLFEPYWETESFVNDKLCHVVIRDERWVVARPATWESVSEILIRIMGAGHRGVDVFSPATAGYIPGRGGLFSSGYHWFRRHLRRLKWFCLFWLEKHDQFELQLWAKRGRRNVCARLFRQLTGGEHPRVRAEVNRERRRRRMLHSLGLLGLLACMVALMVVLWSPRSRYVRLAAWLLLWIPPVPSLVLLVAGSRPFVTNVELPAAEEGSGGPRS